MATNSAKLQKTKVSPKKGKQMNSKGKAVQLFLPAFILLLVCACSNQDVFNNDIETPIEPGQVWYYGCSEPNPFDEDVTCAAVDTIIDVKDGWVKLERKDGEIIVRKESWVRLGATMGKPKANSTIGEHHD